jgi:hypothetical protein
MLTRACLVALILVATAVQAGDTRVRFLRAHRIITDRESVRWIVQVDQHADNRHLFVTAVEGDLVVRSSYEQLDGVEARRTRWIDWGPLPAGELSIVAEVKAGDQQLLGRAVVPVQVISMLP